MIRHLPRRRWLRDDHVFECNGGCGAGASLARGPCQRPGGARSAPPAPGLTPHDMVLGSPHHASGAGFFVAQRVAASLSSSIDGLLSRGLYLGRQRGDAYRFGYLSLYWRRRRPGVAAPADYRARMAPVALFRPTSERRWLLRSHARSGCRSGNRHLRLFAVIRGSSTPAIGGECPNPRTVFAPLPAHNAPH